MTLVGLKRDVSVSIDGIDQMFGASDLDDTAMRLCHLGGSCDAGTVGLLDKARFQKMRRNAYLVNIARGNLVVKKHLIEELEFK